MSARHEAIHEIYRENDRQRREIVVLLNLLSATNYNCVRSSRSCTRFSLSLSRGSLLAQDRHEQNAGVSSGTSLHERGTDAPWFGSSRRSSSDRRRTRMKLDKGRQKQAERECCVCARQSTKQEKHTKTNSRSAKRRKALSTLSIQRMALRRASAAQGSVSPGVLHFRHAVRLLAH